MLVLAALAIVPAADLALGPEVAINGSYSFAAVLSAAVCSVRFTAGVAAVGVGLAVLAGDWNDNFGTLDWGVRLALTTALAGTAVILCRMRISRERALQEMTLIAEAAQRAILRPLPRHVGSVSFAARYVSATRSALVGGDLYDVSSSPYGLRLIIGDVRGKGIGAVQLAGTVLGVFRRAASIHHTLADVAVELEAVVTAAAGEEDFVTVVLVEFHDDRTLTIVNCGHPPPLLIDAESSRWAYLLSDPEPPLGLGLEPTEWRHPWPEGSRLLFYTDGLIEARDAGREFFPLEEHAGILVEDDLDSALEELVGRLLSHAGGNIDDDLALILAEHRPAEE